MRLFPDGISHWFVFAFGVSDEKSQKPGCRQIHERRPQPKRQSIRISHFAMVVVVVAALCSFVFSLRLVVQMPDARCLLLLFGVLFSLVYFQWLSASQVQLTINKSSLV